MRAPLACLLILSASHLPATLGAEPKVDPRPVDQPGQDIVVCGERVAIGTPVILWTDPGGHNAYQPKAAAAAPGAEPKPTSPGFGVRRHNLTQAQQEEIKATGWTRPLLERAVDQFVIHYDVCGTSGKCFEVLQDRNLTVHFMLDLDGTIYQTLDLKEAAWHATKANGRSIGIEIANMGAYPVAELEQSPLAKWYAKEAGGRTAIRLPAGHSVPTRTADAGPLAPSRAEPVVGKIHGQELAMYDLTPEQYAALGKLTAGLCKTFPNLRPDLPRDEGGKVVAHQLDEKTYDKYQGVLGHYHVQANKTDPGPAFQWDRIVPSPHP